MPTSVLRRYTPPTCTLEVRATNSSLSRWTSQTVLRDVQFNLSLDDPQRSHETLVQMSGDRMQLEALGEAIQTYVQQFLDADLATSDPALLQLTPQSPRLLSDSRTSLAESSSNGASLVTMSAPTAAEAGIFLKPRGLLAHDLHLGSLATPESGEVVRLSAVQLFDLANALEEYSAEVLALPGQQRVRGGVPRWASIAAMLVLAVGVTGGITKFVMDVSAPPATQVAQETAPDGTMVAPLPAQTGDPTLGTPLPSPGASPNGQAIPVPPGAPPGALRPATPGAFPFPSATGTPLRPFPQGQPMPSGANPGQVARVPVQTVPPGSIARSPQMVPGATNGQAVPLPPNPTMMQTEPGFAATPAPDRSASATAESAPADPNADIAAIPSARTTPPVDLSRTGVEIPQVQEVQAYFQERWQPPESLGETLEYRIVVGADGSVQQIIPLGDAAGVYIDRTQMPLLGDTFVSPLAPYQAAMVRVVLAPDGRVQTFLEQLN